MAQSSSVLGDFARNIKQAVDVAKAAHEAGSSLVVFPEQFLTGYPLEDLALNSDFQTAAISALQELSSRMARELPDGPALLLGGLAPVDYSLGDNYSNTEKRGKPFNAAFLIQDGQISSWRAKRILPNYGVFDEKRVYEAGPLAGPVEVAGVKIGIAVCEDIWDPEVPECLAESGADILIALNCSPFDENKPDVRLQVALARIAETGLPLVYVNRVGGQDDLVFDGGSFVLNRDYRPAVRLPAFVPAIEHCDWEASDEGWVCQQGTMAPELPRMESLWQAMCLGLKDYVEGNGFPGVLIGLSGGIDSALTAVVAVAALGAARVRCVFMPSVYTSDISYQDAERLAENLGVQFDQAPIEAGLAGTEKMLEHLGGLSGLARENAQARLRGLLLMSLSNQTGFLVLTTGNKSEIAAGYSTLYGDMCGGYSVIKDLYKTDVFALANWWNEAGRMGENRDNGSEIPRRIITRPPSAELRADQKDSDSLPDYAVLDPVLKALLEEGKSRQQILQDGAKPEVIDQAVRLLRTSEYKRRQSAPGVRLSSLAFGKEWRYPLTNHFTL